MPLWRMQKCWSTTKSKSTHGRHGPGWYFVSDKMMLKLFRENNPGYKYVARSFVNPNAIRLVPSPPKGTNHKKWPYKFNKVMSTHPAGTMTKSKVPFYEYFFKKKRRLQNIMGKARIEIQI